MTANLRIINVQIASSSEIQVTFTEPLAPNLVIANVAIISATVNVGDAPVLSLTINGINLIITCVPLVQFASYYLQFQSISGIPFQSLHGDARILEDGVSNRYLISGPIDPSNPVKSYLLNYFNGNIYATDDTTSVISQYLDAMATNWARALYDIRQAQNENYLSFQVVDEQQVRGQGAFDRLNEEGAYEVMRVGLGPTSAGVGATLFFSDFPDFPVTLQQQSNQEVITTSSSNQVGTFDINSLTFNLSNSPVTQVTGIVFTLATAHPLYTYNISLLGYQLLNSRYDQNYASSYALLADNQVRLNQEILNDPNFDVNAIIQISIQYQSKDLGKVIDSNTVSVYTTKTSIREVLPPIINIFNLQHAPITDINNNIPLLGGITFTDPNSNTGAPHPAFITEITFRLSALPYQPGQYSIDYPTGTVYVYGADLTNDGTGPSPPLATYDYRFVYTSQIDYVYDVDLLDMVALPLGNLINATGTIVFSYEEVLIPGIDYTADAHIEALTERINNNLIALNTLTTINSPITNVFQIFNETSGEIYTLQRWEGNKVYFQYNNPPTIIQQLGERASFSLITNELLFVNSITTNTNSVRIFTIFLANNTIVDATEDGIGASFNSSLTFSSGYIFMVERWFNSQLGIININRIQNVGEYMVDYANGVVYLGVSSTQNNSIGTANYKINVIVPQFPHVLSVNDIYYRISVLQPKGQEFSYLSFSDGSIIPQGLQPVDEQDLNANVGAIYQVFNGQVGVFIPTGFVPGVTNQIDYVRGIYEYSDLLFNTNPINFATAATSNGFTVNVNSINKQSFESVQFSGTNYFITLNENIPFLSSDITFTFSITRVSDGASLWNGSGVIVPGNPLTLILPGINSPHLGDLVNVTYSFTINSLSRVVIDYNKGDYWVDYTYLADEIIVSYEYGDNVLDFSQNTTLPAGQTYYVTYRVGALRDALLKNFGMLVNLPQLDTPDLTFPRERYRDALMAALSSFLQGPTVAAIKNIGQVISHIQPQVIESAFQTWSLGQGLLYPLSVETTGAFQLLPAHFGNGALVNQPNQTITLPINSNLRFEEGTFERWIVPQWDGLDNDAILTFSILRDGYILAPYNVFIGAAQYHPTIVNGLFTLTNQSNVMGKPNTNKDGIFIYYNPDPSGNFMRWYVEVMDGYVDGYTAHTYQFKIASTGKYYDFKSLTYPKPSNMTTFTGLSTLNVTINKSAPIDQGFTFLSDVDHYLLDLGKEKDRSRISIYKDTSGYINFRVWDKSHTMYVISADVSGWKSGQAHMVATSWKLNTLNNRDEMHLFIDGLEVPNIIRYGQALQPYLHEKFRTVNPEEVVGLSNRDIVGSDDLTAIAGTNSVVSSINFSQYHISIGDAIFINETGFSSTGYLIDGINGQTLSLNANMPLSLNGNGRFSVNETQFVITDDINVDPGTTVSTIHTFITGADLTTFSMSNVVSSTSTNFTTSNVLPGFSIRIDNSSPELTYTIIGVNGNSLTINSDFPVSQSNSPFQIYSNTENELPGVNALQPDYAISQDINFQNLLTIYNGVLANDLILVRTLGLNNRNIKQQYYIWSNQKEHIIMTQLPAPISLDEVNITKIITSTTVIGPNNSTLSGGVFYSNNLPTTQPSNSQNGRTIQAVIAGTNVDFSQPVEVIISGFTIDSFNVTETISFTDYGTLDFVNSYLSLTNVSVIVKPLNSAKSALTLQVKEKYPITHGEFSGLVPIIRFSYHITGGYNLFNDGYVDGYQVVTDNNNLFSALDINNYLVIHTPASVAGFYLITGISVDRHSLYIVPTYASFTLPLSAFTNGIYQVLNVSQYRSGLQNGFFTLEVSELPGQPYFLSQGYYQFDYATYISAKIDPLNGEIYFGSDLFGNNQVDAILDQAKIYSLMLSDTRIGEVIANNQGSITKDYNSLIPWQADSNTLVLMDFDSFPFTNTAPIYSNTNTDRRHFQSSWAVNDNFEQSIVITNQPIIVPNAGILDTTKQGTVEFWVSPIFDTGNDPNVRYYFDAYGAVVENAISINDVAVKISAPVSKILSVTLAAGNPNVDYFAGGKIELDTQNAIQETGRSIGNSSVAVSQPILQVISVKIIGDFTDTDYFTGGSVSTDGQVIFLGRVLPQNNLTLNIVYQPAINGNKTFNTQVIRLNRRLPNQNCQVVVNYIPNGLQGDRLSIYKDNFGYINFSILASGEQFIIRAPTYWSQNTWHRIKASYKINGGASSDEMRLFLDGYQYTDVLCGPNLIVGKFPMMAGSITVGDGYSLMGNIQFRDPINDLFIGSQYNKQYPIFSLLDNFRISNISRPIYAPYGEPIDVNYSTNLTMVFPVTQDLYTTYLMDFNTLIGLNANFAILTNRSTGSFDFTVNIFDRFDIVSSNPQVKTTLEALINTLKPANTSAYIRYPT